MSARFHLLAPRQFKLFEGGHAIKYFTINLCQQYARHTLADKCQQEDTLVSPHLFEEFSSPISGFFMELLTKQFEYFLEYVRHICHVTLTQ